jgi:DNA-binding response OmpR family regulator
MQAVADAAGANVLLVEDDPSVRLGVASALVAQGFGVHAMRDGSELDDALARFTPDLALLDVRLPGPMDGFELAAELRARSDVPVLFVTAADALEDRLRGFDLGCDDYLVKPFSVRELISRVRAVLRRTGFVNTEAVVGDLVIDTVRRTVRRGSLEVVLTPTEFDLLVEFARRPGTLRSKRELLESVWGIKEHAPHMVEVHVSALRKKLEEHGPRVILTARGGYVMNRS